MRIVGLVRVRLVVRRTERDRVAALLAVTEGVIDQFLLARLVQTPEASLARFVLLAREPNEVAIETQIMSDGILNGERREQMRLLREGDRTDVPASRDCWLRSTDTGRR